MLELGQLEKQHAAFAERGVRIVAVSDDDVPMTEKTQKMFPNLTIVSDENHDIAQAVGVIHKGANQGKDTNAPTTFLVDGTGKVRWYVRPERFIVRLSPEEVLAAIDKHMPEARSK